MDNSLDFLDDSLKIIVYDYLNREKIDEHKDTIKDLIDRQDKNEITKLLGSRLQFGTAGIRGRMGPGYNNMNDLVVIQTAQGLTSYLLDIDSELVIENGVIIGHDARHNSSRYALLMALAFLQKDIKVYFNEDIVPTPFIAFGVKQYGCRAGIMVTASHNPKDDNGIKVYWHNGSQILSPHDKNIQEHINKPENQEPWLRAWDHTILHQFCQIKVGSSFAATDSIFEDIDIPKEWLQLIKPIYLDLNARYFQYIETLVSKEQIVTNKSSNIRITFTPMHGVGHIFMERALAIGGFENIFCVESQREPDPDFVTVKFPNPEETGALDEAFKTASSTKSNLIIANDPDSDRCAAALYDSVTGYKRIFNGNEIGSLLGWWLWHTYTSVKHSNNLINNTNISVQASNCYMISTAVSSKFLSSMARVEGFNFIETLTGFKYMGNITDGIINERDGHVLFAYEEAIGYMVDSKIFDKDGISACVQLAQCAAYCNSIFGRTLEDQLDWLYHRYGYHYNLNSYYICKDAQIIKKIFTSLQANYPSEFGGGFKVKRIRDLNNNFDSSTPDQKAALPSTSSSYMITFFVDDDMTLTIRTSGTEPKIKYYSEIVAQLSESGSMEEKDRVKKRLASFVNNAIKRCLKPDEYKLQPAA